MIQRAHRRTAGLLAATLGIGIVAAPIAAHASEDGRKNTALALGAAAAALLLTQKNKLPGILAAGGAAYAYKRYDDDIRHRHQREREYGDFYNRDRYRNDDYRNRDRYRNDDRNNDRNRYDGYHTGDSGYRRNDNYRGSEPYRNNDGYRYNDDYSRGGRSARR